MFTVFKREIKGLFCSYRGYAFVGLYSILYCLVRMAYHYLVYSTPSSVLTEAPYIFTAMEYMLNYLPLTFALAAPLITSWIFSAERDGNTLAFLRTLPVSAADIFFGKYLALLLTSLVPTAVFYAVSWLLGFFGGGETLTVAVNLLSFVLVISAILSVQIFVSVAIKNKFVALGVNYGVSAVFILLISTRYFMPYALRRVFEVLSLIGSFEASLYGSLDIAALVLQISVIAVFTLLAYLFVKKELTLSPKETFVKKKLIPASALSLGALLAVNAVFGALPVSHMNIDLTSDGVYTVSEDAVKYLSGIEDETTIYVLDADGSDKKMEYFLHEIGSVSDKLKVKWVKSKDVKEMTDAHEISDYVSPYFLLVEGSRRTTFVDMSNLITYTTDNDTLKSYIGAESVGALDYVYLAQNIYKYVLQSTDSNTQQSYYSVLNLLLYDTEKSLRGEEYICRMVEYVNIDVIPARYLLTGHGEAVFDETELGYVMGDVASKNGVDYLPLNTSDGGAIPEDATSILVLDPKNDISKAEAEAFIEYIKKGGQMTFLTSDGATSMPNLMSVMAAFGLSAEKGIVGEFAEIEATPDENAEEGSEAPEKTTVQRTELAAHINTDHATMAQLKGRVVTPVISGANAIKLDNSKGYTLTPVLTTSEKSYIGDATEDLAPRTIAAAAEDSESGAKLLWFTGASSFTHPILDNNDLLNESLVADLYSNCSLVISSMGWVPFTYASTVTPIEAKGFSQTLMTVNSSNFIWFTVIIAVMAVAVALVGVIVVYRRKKMRAINKISGK